MSCVRFAAAKVASHKGFAARRLFKAMAFSIPVRMGVVACLVTILTVGWPGLVASRASAQEHGGGGGGHSQGGGGGGGHSQGGGDESDEGADHTDEGGEEGHGDGGGKGGGTSIWVPPRRHGGTKGGDGNIQIDSAYGGRSGQNDAEELIFRRAGGGSGGAGGLLDEAASGRGKKPVWAGGAVPEDIELGRLNAARAPSSVRDHALLEAYRSTLDKDQDGKLDESADIGAIESPVSNLALYEQAIGRGGWTLDAAARFLGQAAEKNLPISSETVYAVHTILGLQDPITVFDGFYYERAAAIDAATLAAVFGSENVSASGVNGFAQAADDIRVLQKFTHDHPEAETAN